jgi:redox-sensitive bicupin YhaK (pirin superfamily)
LLVAAKWAAGGAAMTMKSRQRREVEPYVILHPQDYVVLGEQVFGVPGLEAVEVVGPFSPIVASGPLITVHDARIEPQRGISHYAHRNNERIFYIMAGELDHDDALNDVKGHLATGDAGLFTEGQRGMLHSEWNNGDSVTHAFVLVYPTRPVPAQTAFAILPHAEMPVVEREGVTTIEIVGLASPMVVNGDIHLFSDNSLRKGSSLDVTLGAREGGLIFVQAGQLRLDGAKLSQSDSVLFAPQDRERRFVLEALSEARVLRVVHGEGFGLQRQWREAAT